MQSQLFHTERYRTAEGRVELLTCAAFARAGVPHGFSFRHRSAGGEPFGLRDQAESDRRYLTAALGVPDWTVMRQVHGNEVVTINRASSESPVCDGLASRSHGTGLVVHTADCVPLLLWSERDGGVAAVHAGWRGTLASVATAAVETMERDLDSRPEDLHVAIGPAIRRCCFEVGDEVIAAFGESGRDIDEISMPGTGERRHLDLIADNRNQLESKGVAPQRIYDSGACTACDNDRFYSYRREGKGVGRLMAAIATRG